MGADATGARRSNPSRRSGNRKATLSRQHRCEPRLICSRSASLSLQPPPIFESAYRKQFMCYHFRNNVYGKDMGNKLARLQKIRWPLLCILSMAALLGAPFLGSKVVESAATLIGSALGAIAAVAGAMWVAERQTAQQGRTAAAMVHALCYPVSTALNQLTALYGPPSRPERGENNTEPDTLSADEWRSINVQAGLTLKMYEIFSSKIHHYEAALNMLSAQSLHIALDLEAGLEEAIRDAVRPLALGSDRGISFFGGPAHWTSRSNLTKANHIIQTYMTLLEREAS
jgi:hypothetical protein